jgi:hypothetical protein
MRTLYNMIQAVYSYWTTFINAMWHMKYERSIADPCLYYHWTKEGLILWLSWVDDSLVCRKHDGGRSQEQTQGAF